MPAPPTFNGGFPRSENGYKRYSIDVIWTKIDSKQKSIVIVCACRYSISIDMAKRGVYPCS